jgi:hypothetical protein
MFLLLFAHRHGVEPVTPDEPSYVATAIFKDRDSFESWAETATTNISKSAQKRAPEKVYYEGTLVISSGTYYFVDAESFVVVCLRNSYKR